MTESNLPRLRRTQPPIEPRGSSANGSGASRTIRAFGLLAASILLTPSISWALPSFARQLNVSCVVCHTSFPELNSFGRQFKLSGYTMASPGSDLPPLAVMLQPSFTHTSKGQEGGAAPGFKDNNNYTLNAASIYYAGQLFGPYPSKLFSPEVARALGKFGIFYQVTYDGIAKAWALDMFELHWANSGKLFGQNANYGVYANNGPGMNDPWNSSSAWSFPFSGSGLAPGPAAGTLIDGGLGGSVVGVGAYAMFNNSIYVDVAGYHTVGSKLLKEIGVTPGDAPDIGGYAPYWRIAYEKMVGTGDLEIGTFGLAADTAPGGDLSAGKDRTVDMGLDSQYQTTMGKNDVSTTIAWTHEKQSWNATEAMGGASNLSDTLKVLKLTVHELYDKTYGLSAQYFTIKGNADSLLYPDSATGSPDSDGFVIQADYLPFNKAGGPAFWPKSNVKFTLQYTVFTRLDGSTANASDNNTLYAQAWLVF